MKIFLPLLALGLGAGSSLAMAGTEYGNVISSTPVVGPVTVPQQQCTEQPVNVAPPTSGGGALLGAIVGGVVGHGLGEGFGRAAATGLGVVAGSVVGDRVEAGSTPGATTPLRSCQLVQTVENRVLGYDVTYDYNGRHYTARLAQDPGDRIALDVQVAPQQGAVGWVAPQPVAPLANTAPTVIYSGTTVYPYMAPPYSYGYAYPAIVPRVGVGVVLGVREHRRGG